MKINCDNRDRKSIALDHTYHKTKYPDSEIEKKKHDKNSS